MSASTFFFNTSSEIPAGVWLASLVLSVEAKNEPIRSLGVEGDAESGYALLMQLVSV